MLSPAGRFATFIDECEHVDDKYIQIGEGKIAISVTIITDAPTAARVQRALTDAIEPFLPPVKNPGDCKGCGS